MVLTLKFITNKSDSVKESLKILRKNKKKKVCYVTLNKSCKALREIFKKKKINPDQIRYIDGISSMIKTPAPTKGCVYVSSPYDLKAISREIKKEIRAGASVVIFDSISNLLKYGSAAPAGVGLLARFGDSFSDALSKKGGNAVFFCEKADKGNLLIEETLPVFDKVIGGKK
jgi:predicted ATP-dependent serine protease